MKSRQFQRLGKHRMTDTPTLGVPLILPAKNFIPSFQLQDNNAKLPPSRAASHLREEFSLLPAPYRYSIRHSSDHYGGP